MTPSPDAPTVAAPFVLPGSMASAAFVESRRSTRRGGATKNAPYARPVAVRQQALRTGPLDSLRWWLVRPGRIEFLLWFAGTILLLGITALFMFTLAVNMDQPAARPAHISQVPTLEATSATCATTPTGAGGQTCLPVTASSSTSLKMTLLDGASLKVGTALHVRGQGFSPGGQVMFLHDTNLPCQPASTRADARGEFSVALLLGNGPGWQPGSHQIVVDDVMSRRSIVLMVTLTAVPAATPTPVQTPDSQSGPAPAGPPSVNQGPPVAVPPTSVPAKPTPLPTVVSVNPTHPPTSAPIKPTPTPTPVPKPTPTPTAVATPTPTGDNASPTAVPTSGVTPTPGGQSPAS